VFIQLTTEISDEVQLQSLDVPYIVKRLETGKKLSHEEAMNKKLIIIQR